MDRLRRKLNDAPHATPSLTPPAPKAPQCTTVHIPLTTDPELAALYRNPWGRLRIGKLLEDLDSLAGNVAYLHVDDDNPMTTPPILVTASVDTIRLRNHIPMHADVRLEGRVVWTGKSSMDIRMEVFSGIEAQPSLSAIFTFVSRHPVTHQSMAIGGLLLETTPQREEFAARQHIADARKKQSGSTSPSPPTPQSLALVEAGRRLAELPSLSSDAMLMRDTRQSNTFITQPQHQNIHGKVFGGFILRRAFELAFSSCYLHAGSKPSFVSMDRVSFRRPVEVGDLLRFTSHVVHVQRLEKKDEGYRIFLEVVANITRPESCSSELSNTFTFTFQVGAGMVKRVLPCTSEEAAKCGDVGP